MNWLDTLQNLSKMNLEMKKKKQNLLKMRNKFQKIQNLPSEVIVESKSEVIVEEPTKDESKSEVIVEEPTKDESKSEVIVEESSATTKLQD